jgi:hypothetical protein
MAISFYKAIKTITINPDGSVDFDPYYYLKAVVTKGEKSVGLSSELLRESDPAEMKREVAKKLREAAIQAEKELEGGQPDVEKIRQKEIARLNERLRSIIHRRWPEGATNCGDHIYDIKTRIRELGGNPYIGGRELL